MQPRDVSSRCLAVRLRTCADGHRTANHMLFLSAYVCILYYFFRITSG